MSRPYLKLKSLSRLMRGVSGLVCLIALVSATAAPAGQTTSRKPIRLAVTTSFENSGLAKKLLPAFEADTGFKVHMIVVGTGQALRLGKAGDVDAVLVHSKPDELAFLKAGYGDRRCRIMYNDFVLVGPKSDPAKINSAKTVREAMSKLAAGRGLFVSRGDDSGTHKKEEFLWRLAGVDNSARGIGWYRPVGAGMGATLNIAAAQDAYTLSDRGTWLKFNNKRGLVLLYEGDPPLHNQYGLLLVNPRRHPYVNTAGASRLMSWLISSRGQKLIGDYRLRNKQLFIPNYKQNGSCQQSPSP